MTVKTSIALAATLLMASSPGWSQGTASDRTVEQFSCRDLVRESGANRDVAIAFLHGFILGKAGGQTFNLDTLARQTDAFLDLCLDNPKEKAIDAMLKIKK